LIISFFNMFRFCCKILCDVLFMTGLATAARAQYGYKPGDVRTDVDYGDVTYSDFYENLAPFGQWIDDQQYGYVWAPDVDADFRPYYTGGHWVATEYGNTWVSDYSWGWACFHYGRWTYDNYYGWLWVPGTNWGPAWVNWRSGENFYGWAPLSPGFDMGAAYGSYSCPADWWVFVPSQYVYASNFYRYWHGPRNNNHLVANTTFINNTYTSNNIVYVSGPNPRQVQQATNQPVQVFKLTNSSSFNTREHNNVVRMYRPAEVRQVPAGTDQRGTPPGLVSAPRPVRVGQAVNSSETSAPQFRNEMHNRKAPPVPGTSFNEVATPRQVTLRADPRPMDYDRKPQQADPRRDNERMGPTPQPRNTERR
jgi:hypothetical protein